MNRHIDAELQKLNQMILSMGGAVERAIEESCQAVIHREPSRFARVHTFEIEINAHHIDIDQACFNLLALQAPVAKDLRFVLAIVKINTDLERMGDHTVNVSHYGADYLKHPALPIANQLAPMAGEVKLMVKDSLDAFVRRDVALSREIIGRDDRVDRAKDAIVERLKKNMAEDKNLIEPCLDLIMITRNLERLADHATNVAEEVIFWATGDDIRHGHQQQA